MGVAINGVSVDIPGVVSRCYLDDPLVDGFKVPHSPNVYRKGNCNEALWLRPITGIVLHTVHGTARHGIDIDPKTNKPVVSIDHAEAEAYATDFARVVPGGGQPGAQLIIAFDGTVLCICDLLLERAWHATGANGHTIGIELDQRQSGTVTDATTKTMARVLDWLTARDEWDVFRMVPAIKDVTGKRVVEPERPSRLLGDHGGPSGLDFHGIFAHGHQTFNRELGYDDQHEGDPGAEPFEYLLSIGYEGFDVAHNEDKVVWEARQRAIGTPTQRCNGVPDAETRLALVNVSKPRGQWVPRPGDAPTPAHPTLALG